jgi:multicomponent Na+:H+ antiporter subunit D
MPLPAVLTPLPVALPLLGAAVLSGLRKWLPRAAADSIAILVALFTLTATSLLLHHAATHGTTVYWFGNWHPNGLMAIGISFFVDTIGAGLATVASLLTFLALLFSWRFVESADNHFQPLMLILLASMCGFSLTADIFNLFVFFELMSTAAFALCGLQTAEPAPLQGGFNFAVTNTIAAFLVLTGIGMLNAITGALDMAQIGLAIGPRHDSLVVFAFTLLICGFLIKAAIAPFHLWMPDAHAATPTPVCVLFSGIMVELGLYAIVRIHAVVFAQSFASHNSQLSGIVLSFAAASGLLTGLMCYAEHHLKRMLSFSTVCHASLMLMLAFALPAPAAIAAMLAYLLVHALLKSGLFFITGIMLHRLRSIGERKLFTRGIALHWTATLWFLGAIGLAAAPSFALAFGEAAAGRAAHPAGLHALSLFFLFGGAITSAAVLRIGAHTFLGWGDIPITDRSAELPELPEIHANDQKIFWYHFTPAALCILGALALPFVPAWLPALRDGAVALANKTAYIHTIYTGHAAPLTLPFYTHFSPRDAFPSAALHSLLALGLAVLLAASSVFRLKVRRTLRFGPALERGLKPLRDMQSGHPGDYVLWLTVGLAIFGSAAMLLLR